MGGFTQNANESFNATVWRLDPKHLSCGSKIIEIVAYLAIGMFNDGYMYVCIESYERSRTENWPRVQKIC